MNEQQWLASSDPAAMLHALERGMRQHATDPFITCGSREGKPSDRKLLLWVVSLADAYHRGEMDLMQAYLWIDGKVAPPASSPTRWSLYDLDAGVCATDAIANFTKAGVVPRRMVTLAGFHEARRRVDTTDVAALLRDIVGNPFRPVTLPTVQIGDSLAMLTEPEYRLVPAGPRDRVAATVVEVREKQMVVAPVGAKIHRAHWPLPPCPWLTTTVRTIAQRIYDDRAFGETGVLADALEDAGCDPESEIVRHLRGEERCWDCAGTRTRTTRWRIAEMDAGEYGTTTGPCDRCNATGWRKRTVACVRGCHVLDLILGKE